MDKYERNRFTGRAGELRVASELLLRELGASIPEVDIGYDVLAENGCRIQIKSSRFRKTESTIRCYGQSVYSFAFQRDKIVASGTKNIKCRPSRQFIDYCDIVVFFGIDEGRFWIVPSELLKGRTTVWLGPVNYRGFNQELERMKKLQEGGMSTYQIAKEIGIRQSSVWKRLNTKTSLKHPERWTTQVRLCENAWDNIIDFGKPDAVTDQEDI